MKPTTLAPVAFISLLSLTFMFTSACGAPPASSAAAEEDDAAGAQMVAPVVLNIGIDQLHVARAVFDLDTTIVRFVDPAGELPLDRVQVLANGFAPEDLDHIIARCSVLEGYEITGGDAFVVGQGEALLGAGMTSDGAHCAVCGFAVICPGSCPALGPGDVPHGAASFDDGDPRDDSDENVTGGDGNGGDTGTDGGGSSGSNGGNASGGSAGDSGSGASSGGSGGSHGGVGNPGS